MQKRIQNSLLLGFIFVSTSYSAFSVTRILATSQLQDFRLYYLGAQAVLLGKNPYEEVQGVIYPPISLVLLTPFASLPLDFAEDVWTLFSLIALLSSVLLLLGVSKTFTMRNFFIVTGLAMLNFPVKFNLGMGQINLILLLLTCLSFFWYRKRLSVLAGSALAVAAALKLTPLVLVLFFLQKRQWKIVISCVVGFILLNGLGLTLLGTNATTDYWQKIFPAIPTVGNAIYYNQAFTGWLARAEIADNVARVINYLIFGGMLAMSWLATRKKGQPVTVELSELGLFIISVLVGTGLAWQHHYVTLLIPFFAVLLLAMNLKISKVKYLVAIGIAYLLVAANLKNPFAVLGIWQHIMLSHVLIGAVLLYIVTLVSLRGPTKQ
ncbi:MAG TPA: glycosyltransferase family 87 protein [Candidatus Woesebacteria bacterium]|nr:glycosyltransferase family 87 protein [Candidatus Woesebacteria bacterium]HNS65112.1 glycosyltransferase family 87 protein [Candidatus Woesebacteria bacterium]